MIIISWNRMMINGQSVKITNLEFGFYTLDKSPKSVFYQIWIKFTLKKYLRVYSNWIGLDAEKTSYSVKNYINSYHTQEVK